MFFYGIFDISGFSQDFGFWRHRNCRYGDLNCFDLLSSFWIFPFSMNFSNVEPYMDRTIHIFWYVELNMDRTVHIFCYIELYMDRTVHTLWHVDLHGPYGPYVGQHSRTWNVAVQTEVIIPEIGTSESMQIHTKNSPTLHKHINV